MQTGNTKQRCVISLSLMYCYDCRLLTRLLLFRLPLPQPKLLVFNRSKKTTTKKRGISHIGKDNLSGFVLCYFCFFLFPISNIRPCDPSHRRHNTKQHQRHIENAMRYQMGSISCCCLIEWPNGMYAELNVSIWSIVYLSHEVKTFECICGLSHSLNL